MGISNSNTIPQLAEAVMDRNSTEHTQNEVNQKEQPQLKKHITKITECEGRSHLSNCQARPLSKLRMLILCVI